MKSKISKQLVANINIEGLEILRRISANSCLSVQAICTNRTNVKVKILEA